MEENISRFKKLLFLLKVSSSKSSAIFNYIFSPAMLDDQYIEECVFQQNLNAGWNRIKK